MNKNIHHNADNAYWNESFQVLSTIRKQHPASVFNKIITSKIKFSSIHFLFSFIAILFSSSVFAQSGATVSASGSTKICSGNTVALQINNAPIGSTYQWLRNKSEINGAVTTSYLAAQAGTYTAVVFYNNLRDTLNDIQVTKSADATLNGTGATIINGQPYFKVCSAIAQNFTFTNASSTTSSNTKYVIKWGDGTSDYVSNSFNTSIGHLFPIGTRKMTFIVYVGSCVDSTVYTVFVGNIPAGGLVGIGGSTICSKNEQQFIIAGTQNNPPGTMYIMSYNDGSKRDTFYHPAPDTVSHSFDTSSCGFNSSNGIRTFPNSFGAFLTIVNPCGSAGGSILPIYVSDKPKPEFSVAPSDTSCVNQVLTITNTTRLTYNVENGTCTPVKFIWRIKALSPGGAWTITSGSLGNDFGSGDPSVWTTGTKIIKPRFTVVGTYSVKLVMINSTLCGADSIERIICVNPLPTASMNVDITSGCAPLIVNASGNTNEAICGVNKYKWSVAYTANPGCKPETSSFTYINSTNDSIQNPQIRFNNPGIYKLRLQVTTPGSKCASEIKEIQIIVKGKPVVVIAAPSQICLSEKIRPSVTASCYTTDATYQWSFTGGQPSSFAGMVTDSVSYATSGSYNIRLSATNECGTSDSVRQLIVKPLPVMAQPVDITVCSGQRVNLTSFASNLPNTIFNWTNDQASIGLAASGTGSISAFTATNTTALPIKATIRVTPILNGCPGDVKIFNITIKPLPTTPVVGNMEYCQFEISSSLSTLPDAGNDLRWYDLQSGGAFSKTAPTPSTASPGIRTFYVSQYNPATGCESQRAGIIVTVNEKPVVQNISREICNKEAFELIPVASVTGTTYSWAIPSLDAGLSGGNAGVKQTSIKDKLENTTTGNQTATYTITPSTGKCAGDVFNATIIVKPSPQINKKEVTICSESLFAIKPVNGENNDRVPVGTLYSWGIPVVNPAGAIAGSSPSSSSQTEISQSLFNVGGQAATVTYHVAPKTNGLNGCAGDSFSVVVTVIPKAKIQKQTVTICSRTAFDVKPLDQVGGNIVPANTAYIWSDPVVTPAGAITGGSAQSVPQLSISQRLQNITGSTAMIVYKVTPVTGTQPSCAGDVFDVVVYVNPQVAIPDQHAEICSGNIFSVIPTGTPVFTTYTWGLPERNPAGAVSGGFAQTIPQQAISQELNNATNQTATLTYTVIPKTANCTDDPFKVVVTVFPRPSIKDTIIQVCTGNLLSYKPENNVAGSIIPENTKYSWSNPVITPAGAVSGFTSQAVPQPAFMQQLKNNTNAPASITYTMVAYSGAEGNCISKPFKVTVLVQPDAKAIMNYARHISCAPFVLNATNLLNASPATASNQYTWLFNGQVAGTMRDFPGYTISKENDSLRVDLIAQSDYGCKGDTAKAVFYTSPISNALFSASVDTACGPITIGFKNLSVSSQVLGYSWDFGNGQYSSLYQPDSITYRPAFNYGDTTYSITLSVISTCDTVTYNKKIVIRSAPKASFIPNRVSGCSPVEVLFTNTSQGVNNMYEWNFGDGTASVTQNKVDTITHWYYTGAVSTFNAKLSVRNHCGIDVVTVPMFIRPNLIKLDVLTDGNFTKGCAPLKVKFINQSSGSASYKWDFGDGNLLIRSNGKDTVYHTFMTPGKFDVKIFSSNGCSDTAAYVAAVQTFETPASAFTADKYAACKGDSIRFSNKSSGATNYTWLFGVGAASSLENPSYAYAIGGMFNVNLIATKYHAAGVACSDTSIQKVTITDTSIANFQLSSDRGFCTPFVVSFQQPITSVSSVSWDFGDGNKSNDLNPTHSYSNNGTYQARLAVKSLGGCVYTGMRTITVSAPEGTAKVKSGYYCAETPVQFTASAFNTDSIEWNFGDGIKQTTGNIGMVYHRFTKPGVYVPSVSLRNVGGCVYEIKLKDTVRVENVEAGFKTNTQKYCGYTEVQFEDTSHSLYGPNQIKWIFGDGTTAIGSSVTHRYNINGNYPVKMMVNGKVGCNDTAVFMLPVEINNNPDIQINAKNTTCTDLVTEFAAASQLNNDISFYKWQISNGFTSGTDRLNYKFVNVGTYKVTLIAGTAQQCYDTATLNVQVLQSPSVKVSSDVTICREKSIGLQATGALSYTWYPVEGLNCTNCPNPLARPYATTQYVAKGIAANGCYQFDTVTVSVKQPFKISASKSDSLCIGKSMQLTASGADSYTWSPAVALSNPLSATPVATPTISTTYRVIGSDNQCFTDTAYVRIGVGKIPAIELGADQILNTGAPYKIKPVVTNGPVKTWSWTPATDLSCADCAEPVAAPGNNMTYTATAVTTYGCVAKDTISFKVFCENSQVFVPNAFTPDGDGINDVLMVRARGISKVRYFRIFNRWGEIVFERYNFQPNDQANAWDGKYKGQESGPAVYVYMLEVECSNGTPFTYKGNITLVK